MDKMIVIGGGGHAKVIINILLKDGKYDLIGYTDRNDRGEILGVAYLGDDPALEKVLTVHPGCRAVLGVGNVEVSGRRREVRDRTAGLGLSFPEIVSPDATVARDVKVGEGTVVFDGAVVNPGTEIGEFAVLNTGCRVDHDCRVGDFVHIAPGATVCGGVTVGDNSMIGAGATVINCRTIGEDCFIGAGAVVVDDCREAGTYLGFPARRKK